jgi:membrane associated rhomboid family serine protease
MIRILAVWILISVAIGFLVTVWQAAAGQERWKLTKTAAFAIICGLISSLLLGFIYILF